MAVAVWFFCDIVCELPDFFFRGNVIIWFVRKVSHRQFDTKSKIVIHSFKRNKHFWLSCSVQLTLKKSNRKTAVSDRIFFISSIWKVNPTKWFIFSVISINLCIFIQFKFYFFAFLCKDTLCLKKKLGKPQNWTQYQRYDGYIWIKWDDAKTTKVFPRFTKKSHNKIEPLLERDTHTSSYMFHPTRAHTH